MDDMETIWTKIWRAPRVKGIMKQRASPKYKEMLGLYKYLIHRIKQVWMLGYIFPQTNWSCQDVTLPMSCYKYSDRSAKALGHRDAFATCHQPKTHI